MDNKTVISHLRAWLNHIPIEDPVNRRMAFLLQVVLIGFIVIVLLAAAINLVIAAEISWPANLVRTGIAILIIGIPLGLLRRGFFHGPVLSIVAIFVVLESYAVMLAGLREAAVTLSFFTLAILLAGLLLERRALVFVFLLCAGVVAFSAFQEQAAGLGNEGIAIAGNFILLNGLISLFLDRFGVTLRTSLASALKRESELEKEIKERRQANEALRDSEERYRALFDTARDVIFTISPDGKITSLNPSFEIFTGWSREEWLGRLFEELVVEEDLPRVREQFNRILRGESLRSFKLRVRTSVDKALVVELNTSPYIKGGKTVGLLGIARDMTEEQRAEDALKASERRLTSLINSAMDAVIGIDNDQQIMLFNPAAERVFGYKAEDMLGQPLDILLPARHRTAHARHIANFGKTRITARGMKGFGEVTGLRKDGVEFPLEASISQMDIGGEKLFTVILRDVTERKQAEDAIRNERNFSETALDSLPGVFYMFDGGGKFIRWNKNFELVTGYVGDEISHMSPLDFFAEDEKGLVAECIREVFDMGASSVEANFVSKDGASTPFYLTGRTFYVGGEQFLLGVGIDIAERKQTEEILRQAEVRYRTLVEQLPIVVYVNPAGDISSTIYVSPQIKSFLGFTQEEWLADPNFWSKALHPEDRQRVLTKVEHINQSGEPFDEEYRMTTRDGRVVWIRDQAILLRDSEGHPLLWQGLMTDITESKQAEEEIQRKADEMTALYETTHDLVIAQDLTSLLHTIVERATGLLGTSGGGLYLCEPAQRQVRCAVSHNTLRDYTGVVLTYGEGAAGIVAETGEPLIIDDYRTWDGRAAIYEDDQPFISILSIPMHWQDHVIGVIHVHENARSRTFTQEDLTVLTLFANQAAIAIENARLFNETQKRLRQLEVLQTIASALRAANSPDEALPIILDQLISPLNAGSALMDLLDPSSDEIVTVAAQGVWGPVAGLRTSRDAGVTGRVLATGQPYITTDLKANGLVVRPDLVGGLNAAACVPIIAQHQPIGALWIGRQTPILKEEVSLLSAIAEMAGNAIHRMRLYEQTEHLLRDLQLSNIELSNAYDTTLEGWAKALELRDKETEGHSRRVTDLTLRLAQRMGISEPALTHIRRGVLLHDIGKMGISDQLLRKTGPLTDPEWAEMRNHPQYAHDLLHPIAYLRQALDIPYCHHEKWDGSGYPRGLKGKRIPLAARIFAVVDVFDALSFDRPYRTAWSRRKVLNYLREQSGRHFDPQVVDSFIKLLSDKGLVHEIKKS